MGRQTSTDSRCPERQIQSLLVGSNQSLVQATGLVKVTTKLLA